VGFSMHFNGIDLNEIFRITDIEGRGPFMQEILRQSISGRDGSYRIDRRIPERPLNVEGRILAKNKEDLREKVNYLNRILYTNDAVAIVFSDEPDVTYYGEYAGGAGWEEKFIRGRGTLPFICYNPYKYSPETRTQLNESIEIDSPAGVIPVFNIEFTENTNEFSIRHKQTRRHLTVKYDFGIGDKLTLNAVNRRVQINGITRMQTLTWDSAWFELVNGNNVFEITENVGNVELRYRERWL